MAGTCSLLREWKRCQFRVITNFVSLSIIHFRNNDIETNTMVGTKQLSFRSELKSMKVYKNGLYYP